MPNHITNILTAYGDKEKVRAMFEAIKNDEIGAGSIDFNKIVPMPEHIYRGTWAGRRLKSTVLKTAGMTGA